MILIIILLKYEFFSEIGIMLHIATFFLFFCTCYSLCVYRAHITWCDEHAGKGDILQVPLAGRLKTIELVWNNVFNCPLNVTLVSGYFYRFSKIIPLIIPISLNCIFSISPIYNPSKLSIAPRACATPGGILG